MSQYSTKTEVRSAAILNPRVIAKAMCQSGDPQRHSESLHKIGEPRIPVLFSIN